MRLYLIKSEMSNIAKCFQHFIIGITRGLCRSVCAPDMEVDIYLFTKSNFVKTDSNSSNSTNFRGLTSLFVERERRLVGLFKLLY